MRRRGKLRPGLSALVGVLSAALALGVGELVAALVHPRSSPVVAVGAAFIEGVPAWLKDLAIAVFGVHDKLALLVGIIVVLTAFSAAIGMAAYRHLGLGIGGVALLGLLGTVAAVTRPNAATGWALPALAGAAAGAAALALLVKLLIKLLARGPAGAGEAAEPGDGAERPYGPRSAVETGGGTAGPDRRRFILGGVGVAAVAAASGGVGRMLSARRFAVSSARAGLRLPSPAEPAPAVPDGAGLDVHGVPPFFTPNPVFYRVDTVLTVPNVVPDEWALRVHGMVDRELTLGFDDLLRRELIERDITLACVSNPVGGSLVGNARWLGVRLADVLAEAGVRPGADQVLSRSADGWTCGTPTETIMDGRDAMLAVGMNGEPLPVRHGFPVRMVVPGLYGYVSATKWITDLELTTFDRASAYWVERGWAAHAPVKTMSRIDTPVDGSHVPSGRVPVAGVAWAQHRGVSRVEVRVDEAPWVRARLAPVPSADTWRQWVHYWDAEPGEHRLQVRATDTEDHTQISDRTPPTPDGATGWHSIDVVVD